MSFILDALNKAQREREEQRQPVPQLSTIHDAPVSLAPAIPIKRGKLIAIGAAASAAVLVAAAGVWLSSVGETSSSPSEQAPVAQERGSVERAQPVREPRPTPAQSRGAEPQAMTAPRSDSQPTSQQASRQTSQQTPASPATDDSAGVDGLYASARQSNGESAAEPATGETASAAKPIAVPSIEPSQSAVATAQTPPAVTEQQTPAPAPQPAPDSIHARVDLQYLQQLSWSMQQSLPSISYSAHDPDAAPANRSVVINGSTYRPGAQIAKGLVLEEVLVDGVVLSYRSQKFKLEALNSWVNL